MTKLNAASLRSQTSLRSLWGPRRVVATAAMLLLTLACGQEPAYEAATPALDLGGTWRAVLASPGGELPFFLRFTAQDDGWTAMVINGEEELPTSGVEVEGDQVSIEFSWYDSEITAMASDDGTLRGVWRRTSSEGGVTRLDFSAARYEADRDAAVARFNPWAADAAAGAESMADISGVWSVEFVEEGVEDAEIEPSRGEFQQQGSKLHGTFLTPTGDYRFLAGSFENGWLRLSTFDGAHAFLFQAQATAEGGLSGDFWSRDTYHATWTAERASGDDELLPDAWQAVGLTNDEGRFHFAFDDLDGEAVSIDDPRFDDKVVLVNIFGSWCPNCNDEAPLLAEWHRRYGDQGLEIVGLAYEFSGDPERDRRQVRRFAERYGIEYPLLLAGTSDKSKAAATLPDLTAVLAYPTTIFIGRDGLVRCIHSGFSGPGTGAHYTTLVAELEEAIEELLADGRSDSPAG